MRGTNAYTYAVAHGVDVGYRPLTSIALAWIPQFHAVLLNDSMLAPTRHEALMHGLMHLSARGQELLHQVSRGRISMQDMEREICMMTATELIPAVDLEHELSRSQDVDHIAGTFGVHTATLHLRVNELRHAGLHHLEPQDIDFLTWPDRPALRCHWVADSDRPDDGTYEYHENMHAA